MTRRLAAVLLLLGACGPGDDGWVWTPVEGARCANGSDTGFGLRERDGDDLLIYLMGGGACWDAATCYGLSLAWNVTTGYTGDVFAVERLRGAGIFDVFPDATQVFVPYCTGDLHSGTLTRQHVAEAPTHHVGANNLDAFLARIPAPRGRVFIVGTSAGGYGAQLNADRFVKAFPDHEVHVMADSAAWVPPREKLDQWTQAWGATVRRELPPSSRLGLVSSKRDWMISLFTGLAPDELERQIMALPGNNLIVDGYQHVFFDARDVPGVKHYVEAWRDGTAPFN